MGPPTAESRIMPTNDTELARIADTVLDEASSPDTLHRALDDFALCCSQLSGISPDPSYDGWAEDTFLDHGMAINPQAAAYCVKDYRRTVVFIRGVFAAIKTAQERFVGDPVRILYAGCGPFATLLLPLLTKFEGGELDVYVLDIHQHSLASVRLLLDHFDLNSHAVHTIQADACSYQHPQPLHLIIAETMQKALEQEPQVKVTANLAPQCYPQGIFIPEQIEVQLCLAHLDKEIESFRLHNTIEVATLVKMGQRHPLATLFTLIPEQAASQLQSAQYNPVSAKHELARSRIHVPAVENLASFDALIFTRIKVFAQYQLNDYEAQISLPNKCHDLSQSQSGSSYDVCYELGSYPRFSIKRRHNG